MIYRVFMIFFKLNFFVEGIQISTMNIVIKLTLWCMSLIYSNLYKLFYFCIFFDKGFVTLNFNFNFAYFLSCMYAIAFSFFDIVAIYFIVLLTHEMCAVILNLNYPLTIIYTEFFYSDINIHLIIWINLAI